MFLQLITGKIPYQVDAESVEVYSFVWQVGSGKVAPSYDGDSLADVTKQFVDACLEPDEAKRLAAGQLLDLPFFTV